MELTESIERNGLLQPIIVRETGKDTFLVAGERRIRAIKELWNFGGILRCDNLTIAEGWLPTVTLGDLSDVDAFEAELEENIRRTDLSWQEQAAAISSLHALRQAQNPGHTVADTSIELHDRSDGSYQDSVKKQLVVARHLDDPDVAKAANFRDAFKIIERKEDLKNAAIRSAIVGESFGRHSHRLFLGNCLKWLADLEPAQYDCVLTDPPYGIDADAFGDGAGKLVSITHEYRDSADSFRGLLSSAAPLISRVAKESAHLYICCDIDGFHFLRELFTESGWQCFRTPLVNHKLGGGRVPLPEHGPRRCYELILFAFRGGRKVTAIYPDVIETAADDNLGHGAQKPVGLFTDLLRRSCQPGDSVVDPFAGTGTIFEAAHGLRVRATGIELDPSYYGIAVKRIEGLK